MSVCLCACPRPCPHYCTDPDVTWGSGRGCPLVVQYWADLQSVHGLRCYGNITRTRNVSEYMLVLALCLVLLLWSRADHYIFILSFVLSSSSSSSSSSFLFPFYLRRIGRGNVFSPVCLFVRRITQKLLVDCHEVLEIITLWAIEE